MVAPYSRPIIRQQWKGLQWRKLGLPASALPGRPHVQKTLTHFSDHEEQPETPSTVAVVPSDSSDTHFACDVASSRRSVGQVAVQKTARFFYFFSRCFLHCALTKWTPGRGYWWREYWCTQVRSQQKNLSISISVALGEIPTATCDPSEIATWNRLKFRRGTQRTPLTGPPRWNV